MGISIYVVYNYQNKFKTSKTTSQVPASKKEQVQASPSIRQFLASESKQEQLSSFSLKTDKTSYGVQETFNLQVLVSSDGKQVDGAEFLLTFDPKLIQIGTLKPGTFFSLYPQKIVDNEKGTVRVAALQKPDASKILNQEILITLPVTGVASGQAIFNFVKEKSHIAGYGGQELLKEVVPLTITVD